MNIVITYTISLRNIFLYLYLTRTLWCLDADKVNFVEIMMDDNDVKKIDQDNKIYLNRWE